MSNIVILNKPFHTLCQFTDRDGRNTLSNFIDPQVFPNYYPAGRLDYDSEGLVILTNNGAVQHRISHPKMKMAKCYWVQVEGEIVDDAIKTLCIGVKLKDGPTKPAIAQRISPPAVWAREPPIRSRKNIPTSWLQISLIEGRNRQVRRMTAAVGFPTLRLIRCQIGPWQLGTLLPGEYREDMLHLSKRNKNRRTSAKRNKP